MRNALRLKPASKNQFGINMVDLMMWLVIAALLLAAALQSIGYYQKAAHLSNMKQVAYDAGTNSFAAAANNDGVVNGQIVTAATADTNWTTGTSYSVEGTSDSPYIRVTDPSVPDQQVIYLFDSCGDNYDAGVNVVPIGGTPELTECGVSPTAPSGGGGSSADAGFVAETAERHAYTKITNVGAGQKASVIDFMNKELAWTALKGQAAYRADYDNVGDFDDRPDTIDYYNTYPNRYNDPVMYVDFFNSIERTDVPGLNDLANAYYDAEYSSWGEDASEESALKVLETINAYYLAAAAAPLPSYAMVPAPSAPTELGDRIIAAGSTQSLRISFATPDELDVAADRNRFSTYIAIPRTFVAGYGYNSPESGTANGDKSVVLSVTYDTPAGGWVAGKHDIVVGVKDEVTNIVYYSKVTITIQ